MLVCFAKAKWKRYVLIALTLVLVLTPSRARTGLVKKQEGGSNPYCSNPESNPVPNVLVRALTFLLVLTRALHRR